MKKMIATTSVLLLISACSASAPHDSTYMKHGEMKNNCQDMKDGSAEKKSCQKMMKDCHDMMNKTGTMPGKDNIAYNMRMQCEEMMKDGMK